MKTESIRDNSALIIVDMQNDFLLPPPGGKLFVEGTEEELKSFGDHNDLIIGINSLAKDVFSSESRIYFTTEDCHTEDHIEFSVFPPHCVCGTKGQKYHKDLSEIYNNAVRNIVKGTNVNITSYSLDTSTEFSDHINYLRNRNIENIYIVGVAYNFCVSETAIAYAGQMFNTFIVRNMTLSVPNINKVVEHVLNYYDVQNIIL